MNEKCRKAGKKDPLGICSLGDEESGTTLCPKRFREGPRIFVDAGRLAFGSGRQIVAASEVRVLRVPQTNKRIGKIDYVIAALDEGGKPVDFAALEVQSVYMSGKSIRPAFRRFLRTGGYDDNIANRPDFRSSAQKRLMPQLTLKVPVFRRWGRRFFVVVDERFYAAMPPIKPVEGVKNSEVTWLVYPFVRQEGGVGYHLGEPKIIFTLWDDVLSALREGEAPQESEVLAEIEARVPVLPKFMT